MLPTDKQLRFIALIEEYIDCKFRGKTKKQASVWISKHIEEYRRCRQIEHEQLIDATEGYYSWEAGY